MIKRDRKSRKSRVYIRRVGEGGGIRELELGLLIIEKEVVVKMSFGVCQRPRQLRPQPSHRYISAITRHY